ncbi:hypothetical protein EG68_07891 [Paragonimus skrjabini miyazakii]|uniref:Uncharacterized protein n=1 Tax=Paragonimus skrjabini miyazakii TaxID=59628 RepID=A0A8S9YKY9_9TREM|nr:hypothetical protein EG68_07891 [Paragonimus skrjabini miyazakii]
MPRRVRLDLLPKTPGGHNIRPDVTIPADEVEIDDEVVVKSSMLRQCVPGNPWFEGDGDEDDDAHGHEIKSMDLRKIRSLEDRVAAIVSSPMVDARPRRLSHTQRVNEGLVSYTPLKVHHKNDLMHSTSRRLSQMILNRRSYLFTPKSVGRMSNSEPEISPLQDCSPNVGPSSVDLENKENVLPLASPRPATPLLPSSAKDTTGPTLSGDDPNQSEHSSDVTSAATYAQDTSAIRDFRFLAEVEMGRLWVVCGDWNGVLSEESGQLPKQAIDCIRATVGKCQLVLQHKLPFFLSLVDMAERSANAPSGSGALPKANANDLAGYWTLVADEIARADAAFDRLHKWRDQWNWDLEHCPITPPRLPLAPAKRAGRVGQTPKRLALPKVSKIPTRQTRGQMVKTEDLPLDATQEIVKAAQQSEKKSKTRVRSKLADFLKAKKAAMTSKPASPAIIFALETKESADLVGSTNVMAGLASTPRNTPHFTDVATPGALNKTTPTGSFVVPKQRALRSSSQQINRSAAKSMDTNALAVLPTTSTKKNLLSSGSQVVGTPIVAQRPPCSPHFGSATKTASSATPSSSMPRPGTPRPAPKRKSSSRMTTFPEREVLHSLSHSTGSGRRGDELINSRQLRSALDEKRISFALDEHLSGSETPREVYPVTPANTSGSLVPVSRVLRRSKNLLETLTPLGLRPVSRPTRSTPRRKS